MATLQAVNGKAPEGAQIGDKIVTNGGTFQITGGTPGNWTSQKVSDTASQNYGKDWTPWQPSSGGTTSTATTPTYSNSSSSYSSGGVPIGAKPANDFKGSATGVLFKDENQMAIINQMNQNSQKWWTASSEAERQTLHQQNQALAALLGGSVTYDNATGKWTGTPGEPGGYTPKDNSEYINNMYQAYLEQQKEALKQAYESNLSDLQAEQEKLGANYQSARNQTAGESALSQQRFNETAAAYGLNTGTSGQAALSYANQLQADISALTAAESAANAEIERQRTNLAKEYQSAMIQAQAQNNYEMFQALYQEAVRVDQALQNQSQFNAQQAMSQYQMLLDQYYKDKQWGLTQEQWDWQQQLDKWQQQQADREWGLTQEQWEWQQQLDKWQQSQSSSQTELEKLYAQAELLASAGDYSGYGQIFGWDEAKIQQMENAWKAANTVTQYSGGGSSGGGGRGGGSYSGGSSSASSAGSTTGYDALFTAAMNSGYPESFINNNYESFGFNNKTGLYDEYLSWASSGGLNDDDYQSFENTVKGYLDRSIIADTDRAKQNWQNAAESYISNMWSKLSGAQRLKINQMLAPYGWGYGE